MSSQKIAKIYISADFEELYSHNCYYTFAIIKKSYESKRKNTKGNIKPFIMNEVEEIDVIPDFNDIDKFIEITNTDLKNPRNKYKRKMENKELKLLKENGFEVKSQYFKKTLTVTAEKNGIIFKRTGKELCQCLKSLYFDVKKSSLI